MTAPVIQFDYDKWVTMFPEFAGVSAPMAESYFEIAGLYFANCGWTAALRIAPTLLNLLTAHIAMLLAPQDGDGNPSDVGAPASPLVGRISSASQGSVSVGVELQPSGSPSEAFFTQTKYGLMFWQATAQFRTAQYAARPTVVAGAFPGRRYPNANGYPPWGGLF